MPKFEVTGELLIRCAVKFVVEADDKDSAVGEVPLPHAMFPGSQTGWKAAVTLKAPKGVQCQMSKVTEVTSASGFEKVRKL